MVHFNKIAIELRKYLAKNKKGKIGKSIDLII